MLTTAGRYGTTDVNYVNTEFVHGSKLESIWKKSLLLINIVMKIHIMTYYTEDRNCQVKHLSKYFIHIEFSKHLVMLSIKATYNDKIYNFSEFPIRKKL